MNFADWQAKRAEPERIETPTGLELDVKPYTLLDMIADGIIPADLEPEVDKILRGEPTNTKGLNAIAQLAKMLAERSVVGPAELDVGEIPVGDLIWMFRQSTGRAVAQITGVGTAPDR